MATDTGAINRTYLSSVSFLDQREILKNVLDVAESESFLDVLDYMGRAVPTATIAYDNFVNNSLYAKATLDNDPSGAAAGGSMTVSIGASDVYPAVGEIMMLKSGKQAIVTALDASIASNGTFTVKAIDTIGESDAESGDTVVFISNAHTEGSGANLMRKSNLTKSQNRVQIFKTKTSITDLAAGSKIEVEYKGKPYYFIKQQHDAFLKHRLDVAYGMLYGKGGTTSDADGNTINLTKGLHTYISEKSNDINVASGGSVAVADFSTISRLLDKSRGPAEYMILAGGEIDNAIDTGLATADPFKSGGVQYNAFNGSQDQAVALGFESFRFFGRTYHKKRLQALDNVEVTNPVDAFKFDEYAYFIPDGQMKVAMGEGSVDRIRTRYLELHDGTTTRYREKLLGGLAPTPTSETDTLDVVYTSIEGLEVVGPEQFGWLNLNS